MCGHGQEIVYFVTLTTLILTISAAFNYQPIRNNKHDQEHISLPLKVCYNTIHLSEQPLMYIVDFHSNPIVPPLIQNLHDSSIKTILITHHKKLTTLATNNEKMNFMFFVNNPQEILSLILSSVSKPRQHEENFDGDKIKSSGIHLQPIFSMKEDFESNSKMPHHCVTVGDQHDANLVDCDEHMTVSAAELEGSEILSDRNFNFTRALYINSIWNSNNYLSFMIGQNNPNPVGHAVPKWQENEKLGNRSAIMSVKNEYSGVILCFKFVWRFFRGIRTVICYKGVCDRYDPFSENIVSYSGKVGEAYFDFSVINVNKKVLKIAAFELEGYKIDTSNDFTGVNAIFPILYHLQDSINCTIEFIGDLFAMSQDNRIPLYERGQLSDCHMHLVAVSVTGKSIPYSRFDYSVAVETREICFLTPHSKKIPQFLVPFKSFSPVVWFLIGAVVATFVLMQRAFQSAQLRIFRGVYSEAEIRIFETTSSLFSIYAYFMSGSPPRLVLGNFLTGKILFFIFSFSALIITTAFLGVMTTLLTKTVQYPEIDSIKDLEDSELLIQTGSADAAAVFFEELDGFDKLKTRLVSNLQYYCQTVFDSLPDDYRLVDFLTGRNDTGWNINQDEDPLTEMKKNIRSVLETDAFLVDVSDSVLSKSDIRMKFFVLQKFENHLVRECLMAYPFSYSFLKNSFIFHRLNEVISRFLESGHFQKLMKVSNMTDEEFEGVSLSEGDDEPRPYDLNDLQIGFIALVVGLFLSCLVFAAETLYDNFENVAIFKLLRRILLFFP
ncbi:unnamed protein product [Bemisia tabaci]|uniref:Ionotropic receptor n=1 Tax=Bemisia tabaci TaxID=7038 RepID=A0A9P0A5J8_BEMTA|nr:unnamed protein product [Bemisia tabaci]